MLHHCLNSSFVIVSAVSPCHVCRLVVVLSLSILFFWYANSIHFSNLQTVAGLDERLQIEK